MNLFHWLWKWMLRYFIILESKANGVVPSVYCAAMCKGNRIKLQTRNWKMFYAAWISPSISKRARRAQLWWRQFQNLMDCAVPRLTRGPPWISEACPSLPGTSTRPSPCRPPIRFWGVSAPHTDPRDFHQDCHPGNYYLLINIGIGLEVTIDIDSIDIDR